MTPSKDPGSDVYARMHALTNALGGVLRRLDVIERRLTELEGSAGQAAAEPAQSSFVEPQPEAAALPAPPAAPPLGAPPAAVQGAPAGSLETRVGLNWINRIGGLTLLLGVAFFFKYAVDNAWIGETGRVVLGVLAGLLAIFAGDRLWSRRQEVFAQGVMGLGLAILYLSFTAAFSFYHLVPQIAAMALMALTTAAAGSLALRYNALAIAVLGLAGGYLTPILLRTPHHSTLGLLMYLAVLNCGVAWLALARRWTLLHALGLVFTTLLFGSECREVSGTDMWTAVVFGFVFFAQFAISRSPSIVALAQVLLTVALAVLLPAGQARAYAMLSLVPVATALYIADRRRWRELPPIAATAAWLAMLAWMDVPGSYAILASACVAFVVWLAWTPWLILKRGLASDVEELLLVMANAGLFFVVGYRIIHVHTDSLSGLFAVSVAAAHLGVAMIIRSRIRVVERAQLLAAGLALAFVTLAIPIQLAGFHATLAWAVEAAALAWLAAKMKDARIVAAAVFVYLLVLARLASVDFEIAFNNLFFNGHFLTFAVSAAALLLGAWWWRSDVRSAWPYFAGHVVLLYALIAQLDGWASRHVSAGSYPSAQTAVISFVFAVYAMAFIAAGVAYRSPANRIAGLALFGIIIVKLYAYDVWLFDRVYRVIAFLALGAVLVGGSYIYSRYRARIDALWKDSGAQPVAK